MIYRGYYTVARRCKFYVLVARTISHSFASLTRDILFFPREHKIHIFEPTCNVLFIIWRLYSKQQTRGEKPIQQKQKAGIVTSLNDTTLTKVTYGKYATRVPDEVAYFPVKHSPPYNNKGYTYLWPTYRKKTKQNKNLKII